MPGDGIVIGTEEPVEIVVSSENSGQRIDKIIVSAVPALSRSFVQSLLQSSSVFVNGKAVAKNYKPNEGALIQFIVPAPRELEAVAQNIPLDIRYEDDDLLVVNKPRGMVVHPAAGNYDGTLVNALMYYCSGTLSGINGVIRPGIVHRIDKDTSGLLLVAKNDFAHISLAGQIKEHSLDREYMAVVHGRLKELKGVVDAPIGRSAKNRKMMCVTDRYSRPAVTHYEVIDESADFSLVRLKLETGRTHQIRVHMAYIGHPVAGDPVYGPSNGVTSLNGQCLHAGVLGFTHPSSGQRIVVKSELPSYFTGFLKKSGLRNITE
ncbi:MAG: RluA family pseudouridine synthase [Clostridia bacterium]|nr:RluA family pseudouridine synthase [Clostridia bacterium]MBR0120145.1 RluA family pseudouridine synthase [Clostridia bacterium]